MAKKGTGAAGTTATAKKYPTMVIGISHARATTHEELGALSDRLGCKISDLVWDGIARVLKDPPKTRPEGAQVSTGTAAGFWVRPVVDPKTGKAKDIKVVEVEHRSQVSDGRTFFRYDREDTKSRDRAAKQAVKAAAYDARLLGLKADGITTEKFVAEKA